MNPLICGHIPTRRRIAVACGWPVLLFAFLAGGLIRFEVLHADDAARSETIELAVSLDANSAYSRRDLCREMNQKLGGQFDLERVADRRVVVTARERSFYAALKTLGLLNVEITPDRLVLRVPNREGDQYRLRQRRRLGEQFGLPIADWPEGLGLHVPTGFNPARKTVLLIHGLESNTETLTGWQTAFERLGAQVLLFDYPNDGPIAWSGRKLGEDLQRLRASHPRAEPVVVAHSMGGLVIRSCLETPGQDPGGVSSVFFVGTPHHGSHLAKYQPILEALSQQHAPQWQRLADGLGEAAEDLAPDSQFLRRLNGQRPPGGVRYYCLAGRKGGPEGLLPAKEDAGLPRRFDELRPGRGDGCVAVSSALLKHATKTETFDMNHWELIQVPKTAPETSPIVAWIVATLGWKAP